MKPSAPLVLATSFAIIAILVGLVVYLRLHPRKPTVYDSPIKPAWNYWSWRIYVAVANAATAYLAAQAFAKQDKIYLIATLFLAPFVVVAISTWFTFEAFSFDYSAFGKYRRTPLPTEQPVHQISFSYAIIRKLRTGPLVTWVFYRHGIGIKISTIGDVFLPLEEIDSLEMRGGFMGLTSELTHHCPEVRNPIGVPNTVAKIMAYYYPSKVLVDATAV